MNDQTSAYNDGYIQGLRQAAQWAKAFDQDLPGMDRETCVQLAKGLAAMVDSAQERLSANKHLIWSQHHKMWWGPNRNGYRVHIADAGRYTLNDAHKELRRGCYCCLVPEVVVPAPPLGLNGAALDRYAREEITKATDAAIEAGRVNRYAHCGEVGISFTADDEPVHTEPCCLPYGHDELHDWAQREAAQTETVNG